MSKIYSYLRRAWLFLLVTLFAFPNTAYGCGGNAEIYANSSFFAINRPMNILVIGDKGVGKSKLAASLLRNVKNVSPNNNVQMCEEGISHNKFIAAINNKSLRIIELDTDEFLNLNSDENNLNYLIDNISWVFYVVNENNCKLDRMLIVYDRINQFLCRKNNIGYQSYSRWANKEWWLTLNKESQDLGNNYYSFALIANTGENKIDQEMAATYASMPNSVREVVYVNYGNDRVIPIIPQSLISYLEGQNGYHNKEKQRWSHKKYFQSCCYKFWRNMVECFCCCFTDVEDIENWSYNHDPGDKYLKNQQGTSCVIF